MRHKSHTVESLNSKIYLNKLKEEEMKIITLCREGSCCPVVKLDEDHVEIGEEGNLCTLTRAEWETLKSKILNSEV
jgi:hypothetical protein